PSPNAAASSHPLASQARAGREPTSTPRASLSALQPSPHFPRRTMHRRRTEPRFVENAWPAFPDPSDPQEAAQQAVTAITQAEPETRAKMLDRISRILRNIVRDDPPAPQPRRTDVYVG